MEIADIPALVARLRETFDFGGTRSLEWRLRQIDGVIRFLETREREIVDAVTKDLGKPQIEAVGAEVTFTLADARHIRKHLAAWMKPDRVASTLPTQPATSRVHRDPLGVVLVIAPWNYPVQLAVAPLLGALAGGNCAIVKPSEVSVHTAAMLARWLPEYLDPGAVSVVCGGVPETTALLAERFDHIFYTGNGTVGRIVMQAAAKHLTPVTLELGGKSPCIVDADVDLAVTARRILWGKFYNAGQTCVAPDYVLAHERIHDALLERMRTTLVDFFGADPRRSPDFARIINERHHQRLMGLMESGRVVAGGEADESARYIAPTILRDVAPDSPVMGEEIFGPVLPVLKVVDVDEAIHFVNARPKPLALYVFSRSAAAQEAVVARTSSGGMSINHVWLHVTVPGLPFGGVGESGMGAYHGRASFETFTHRKSVLRKPFAVDPPIAYPPYSATKEKWLRRLL